MSELTGQIQMEMVAEAPAREIPGWNARGELINPAMEDARRLDVLAGQILILEGQAREVFKRTAIEIGTRLIEARGLVRDGQWGAWLREHIDYSERKAQQLMRVAEEYGHGTLPEAYDRLSFTQIYDLLSAPAEERDALAQQAAEEGMSVRQLKARIDEINAEYHKAQASIYDLHQEIEAKEAQLAQERAALQAARADTEAAAASADLARADADRERKRAADALDRARQADQKRKDAEKWKDEAKAAVTKAKAEVDALKSRSPEVVEVTPRAVTEELEDLRRQLREAEDEATRLRSEQSNGISTEAATALAQALQARLYIREAREKMRAALPMISRLRGAEGAKAEALAKEARDLAAFITAEIGG